MRNLTAKICSIVLILMLLFSTFNLAYAQEYLENAGLNTDRLSVTASDGANAIGQKFPTLDKMRFAAKESDSDSRKLVNGFEMPEISRDFSNEKSSVLNVSSESAPVKEQSVSSNVTDALQAPVYTNIPLNFDVADSVYDPVKPIVYLTDSENKKLYAFNYTTKQTASMSFEYPPESLTFANGELYVSLLISGHQYYGSIEKGAVAIVDPGTLTLKSQFNVDIDPFDIEADSGYVYITSGSNQWTEMKSYSLATKLEVSSSGIRHLSYEKLHPTLNRVYTVDTDSSPRDITAYNVSNGVFTDPTYPGGIGSPYHGDYSIGSSFRISPDGKYLFTGTGTIFYCDQSSFRDMHYKYTLDAGGFSDIAFDLPNNRFFVAYTSDYSSNENNCIIAYSYDNLQRLGTYSITDDVASLNYSGGILTAVCKSSSNTYSISTLNTADNVLTPSIPIVSIPDSIKLQGLVSGIVYDESNHKAYAVDKALDLLYVINLDNNQVESTVKLPYVPSNLCISENGEKLYIVNNDENYLVTELDLNTLSINRSLSYKVPGDSNSFGYYDSIHRHIYERNNRIYIIDGESVPVLYVFNATTFAKVANNITGVGDIAITSDNSYLYYWYHGVLANSNVYKYSISGDNFALADQSNYTSYTDFGIDPVDTPIILLEGKGKLICKNNEFDLNNLANSTRKFSEPVYAVNSAGTLAAGKHNVFNLETGAVMPFTSKGEIVSLFFKGDTLMALSKLSDTFYFIETIWYGEKNSLSGTISLGFGVNPDSPVKILVTASNGTYSGYATVYIFGKDSASYTIDNLPATSDYRISYEILDYYGCNADYFGYLPNGYYGSGNSVTDPSLAKTVDLTTGDATANILLTGNRTITGTISLPSGETAPEGGMLFIIGASNVYDTEYFSAFMEAGANSATYTVNVPSTTPGYGINIACYNLFDDRYLVVSGYSKTGAVPMKKFSSDISVKNGSVQNINITLIKGRTISGTVSLPTGALAPAGGIVADIVAVNGEFNTYQTVTIPQGANSITYELSVPISFRPAARLSLNAYSDNGTAYYSDDLYNSSKKLYLPSGETASSKYQISYSIYPDSGYQTSGCYGTNGITVSSGPSDIDVSTGNKNNVNLTILKGQKTISGQVSLPSGILAPAGGQDVYVYAESENVDFDFYTLVNIPQGSNSASYTLNIPAANGYYVSYSIDGSSNSGYLSSGYYSANGTTYAYGSALALDLTSNSKSGINLAISTGTMVSGTIYLDKPLPGDADVIIALWNNDFELDQYVTVPKGAYNVPYKMYVPANNLYCAQYYVLSDLDGVLRQGYFGEGGATVSSFDAAQIIQLGNTSAYGLDFSLVPAYGFITGSISLPDGSGATPYYICVPSGYNGYRVYYYMYSNTPKYEYTGYYSQSGTTVDSSLSTPVNLSSGIASNVNLKLVTASTQNSAISPGTAGFDKYAPAQADITVNVDYKGNTLNVIKKGTSTLVRGTDYVLSGNSVIIKKSYLATLPTGSTVLTFYFSAGNNADLNISVSDSTPSGGGVPGGGTPGGGIPGGGDVIITVPDPSPTPTEEASAVTKPENGMVTATADGNGKVVISTGSYNTIAETADSVNGAKSITIKVSPMGLKSYIVQMPASVFSTAAKDAEIKIVTDLAVVSLPSNMYSAAALSGASNITIRISSVGSTSLSSPVTSLIGNSPVIDLGMLVDGEERQWSNVDAPVTVSLPYTFNKGENGDNVTVFYIDSSNKLVNMKAAYDLANKGLTFKTTHFSKYVVKSNIVTFTDLAGFYDYSIYIESMASKGVIEGVGNNKYAPSKLLTRAEFATLLVKMLQLDTSDKGVIFSDSKANDWYVPYINAAYKVGLIKGVGGNKFAPNNTITTQDAALILVRAMKYKGVTITEGSLAGIKDAGDISSYARSGVGYMVSKGVMPLDSNGYFNAKAYVNRACAAQYIYYVFNYKN